MKNLCVATRNGDCLYDPDLVCHVQCVVVGGQPDVGLLLAVGPKREKMWETRLIDAFECFNKLFGKMIAFSECEQQKGLSFNRDSEIGSGFIIILESGNKR